MTQPTPAGDPTGKVTIMKPATEKETDEVINQLLNIDIPQDDKTADEYNIPLAPIQVPVQPTGDASKDEKIKQTATPVADDANIKPLLLSRVIGTAIKIETPSNNERPTQKKKVFETVEYKLKRKY